MSSNSYDIRLDIPARAYINHQVIRLAENHDDIRRCKEEVFSNPVYSAQGLDPKSYSLLENPAHMASLLYCLVVVPKEILDYPQDHFLFKRHLDQIGLEKAFRISISPHGFEQSPSYWLLRALRNSVAHVLYEFDQSFGMHFWTEQNPRWDAHASLDGLFFFFSTFGREFANTLLLVKRQQLG